MVKVFTKKNFLKKLKKKSLNCCNRSHNNVAQRLCSCQYTPPPSDPRAFQCYFILLTYINFIPARQKKRMAKTQAGEWKRAWLSEETSLSSKLIQIWYPLQLSSRTESFTKPSLAFLDLPTNFSNFYYYCEE